MRAGRVRLKLQAHADRKAVKRVHQADGEGQVADLACAEMLQQRQVNIIFCMGAGNMRHRFRPRQRRLFCGAEMPAYPPAGQRIQFSLRHAGFTQRFTAFQ